MSKPALVSLNIYGYAYIFMDIHTSRYMYDAPCDIHDAFPMRHTYASYSDAFMTRSVSDAWETRLIPSVDDIPGVCILLSLL